MLIFRSTAHNGYRTNAVASSYPPFCPSTLDEKLLHFVVVYSPFYSSGLSVSPNILLAVPYLLTRFQTTCSLQDDKPLPFHFWKQIHHGGAKHLSCRSDTFLSEGFNLNPCWAVLPDYLPKYFHPTKLCLIACFYQIFVVSSGHNVRVMLSTLKHVGKRRKVDLLLVEYRL